MTQLQRALHWLQTHAGQQYTKQEIAKHTTITKDSISKVLRLLHDEYPEIKRTRKRVPKKRTVYYLYWWEGKTE